METAKSRSVTMTMKVTALTVVMGMIMAAVLAPPASAALINFDWGGKSSDNPNTNANDTVGILGGGYWNQGKDMNSSATGTWSGLQDSTGAATGINVDITAATETNPSHAANEHGTDSQGALWDGFLYGSPGDFSISGLTAGAEYELVMYSHWGEWSDVDTVFEIDNAGGGTKTAYDDVSTGWDASFVEGENYVHFTSLIADASGEITGGFAAAPGDVEKARWNGFQMQVIPEPSSLLLLGIAGLLLMRRRRV